MKRGVLFLLLIMLGEASIGATVTKLLSPDGKLELQVIVESGVSVKLFSGHDEVFGIENIGLDTDKGVIPVDNPELEELEKIR